MPLLQAKDLVREFSSTRVVDRVNIEVNAGEIVGLLGTNGAGKTTTFKMISGRLSPSSGQVIFKGEDITSLPMYKRARLGMGYLAQEPSIFEGLNVQDNILAILEFYEKNKKKRKLRLEELLDKLSLTEHRKKISNRLSGGLRRRLEITRALVTNPELILLDEPFAGVDPLVVEDIQNILFILKKDGLGLLITDHNVAATLHVTDRSYIIQSGKILVSGSAEELMNSEVARREYLGSNIIMEKT